MKKIAEIGFAVLGIYLVVSAISYHARSYFSLSQHATFYDYMHMFGPSLILLVGGVLCILFRSYFLGWIFKTQDIEIPKELDIDRIECVLLSLLGAFVILQIIAVSALMLIHFLFSPTVQTTEFGDVPMKSYAFVQFVAYFLELIVAFCLLLFPQKVQKILHKTRGLLTSGSRRA